MQSLITVNRAPYGVRVELGFIAQRFHVITRITDKYFLILYFPSIQVMNESFLPLVGEKQTKFEHEIDKMEVINWPNIFEVQ